MESETGEHTCELEVVVVSHRPHVEMLPHSIGMGIILIADTRVVQLREECILPRQTGFLQALERVHVLLLVQARPDQETQPIIFLFRNLLEVGELVDTPFREVCGEGLYPGSNELQRVIEHEVFAKG